MLSSEIIRELREDHTEANKNLFKWIVCTFETVYYFQMLYIISTTNYMHKLYFLYMLNYPVIYSLSKRERVAINMQGTVSTVARLKIVPSYHQELVPHPMPDILKH